MNEPLKDLRAEIDRIDAEILELLRRRNEAAAEVLRTKLETGLPIYVPEREEQKVAAFRRAAGEAGLDEAWAEDFLRMMMSASRARQSREEFPRSTPEPRTVLIVGGAGRMGALYAGLFRSSGHLVRILEKGDWDRADTLAAGADVAMVAVPIRRTVAVIGKLGPLLDPGALLCDMTSLKTGPVAAMLEAHSGPVLGLHPMHGADVGNLSKQLVVACPGREPEAGRWLLEQFRLWGMRTVTMDADRHDRIMDIVQGIRHFEALLHGSFLASGDLAPADILELSSPIYRAELMMTGRIFAQDPELYADIVFASERRRRRLLEYLEHHESLAALVRADDKDGFMREFLRVRDYFGAFARQALAESGYLIHRLADRFSGSSPTGAGR